MSQAAGHRDFCVTKPGKKWAGTQNEALIFFTSS